LGYVCMQTLLHLINKVIQEQCGLNLLSSTLLLRKYNNTVLTFNHKKKTKGDDEERLESYLQGLLRDGAVPISPPNGTFTYIKSDPQLKTAVDEFCKMKSHHLDIKVIGEGSSSHTPTSYNRAPSPPKSKGTGSFLGNAPSHSGSSSHSASSSHGYTSPSHGSSSSHSSSSSAQEVNVTTFTISADHRSPEKKIRVTATPGYDHFLFVCSPSKFDTTVNVVLEEGTKLVYKCTHLEGMTQVRLTQTFQIPFNVSLNKIEFIPNHHSGQDVRVNM